MNTRATNSLIPPMCLVPQIIAENEERDRQIANLEATGRDGTIIMTPKMVADKNVMAQIGEEGRMRGLTADEMARVECEHVARNYWIGGPIMGPDHKMVTDASGNVMFELNPKFG